MLLKLLKGFIKMIVWSLGTIIAILLLSRIFTSVHAKPRIFSSDMIDVMPVAVVFGAGLYRDGTPTPVLQDRINAAADLYLNGKVTRLLMSGDNRFVNYNEPGAMADHAVALGVPEGDIVLDYAGRRTYDTCYRARDIFGLGEVVLVTQKFHLPRALYTCNKLGLNAIGVEADSRIYRKRSLCYWFLRESIATLVALWEVHVSHPKPVLGGRGPIFDTDQ